MPVRTPSSLNERLQQFEALPPSACVRQPVVLAIYGISASTLWRRVADGSLPKPRKLSARVTVWNVGELRTHLSSI